MNKQRLLAVGMSVMMGAATLTPVVSFAAPPAYAATAQSITQNDRALLRKMFNARDYARMYPELVAILGNNSDALFNHFVNYGLAEGRQINANFNINAYRSAYSDLNAVLGQDILSFYRHYDQFGRRENRTITTVAAAQNAGIIVTSFTGEHLAVDDNGAVVSGKAAEKIIATNPTYANAVDNVKGLSGQAAIAAATRNVTAAPATEVSSNDDQTSSDSSSSSSSVTTQKKYNMEAYNIAHADWAAHEPQPEEFSESYCIAYESWLMQKPLRNDYIVSGADYNSQEEAMQAYTQDMNEWYSSMPEIEDFMTEAETTAYEAALEEWNAAQPQLENYVVNQYESAEAAAAAFANAQSEYNDYLAAKGVWDTKKLAFDNWTSKNPDEYASSLIKKYNYDGTFYDTEAEAEEAKGAGEGSIEEAYFIPGTTEFTAENAKSLPDACEAARQAARPEDPGIAPEVVEAPVESNFAFNANGFASQDDADEAYNNAMGNWYAGTPETYEYMSNSSMANFTAAMNEYDNAMPNVEDPKYAYNNSEFESQEAADEAYNAIFENWTNAEPEYEGLTNEEQAAYEEAHEDWVNYEPVPEDFEDCH